jgi:diguanylate cyclase (GGDEF)-like protein
MEGPVVLPLDQVVDAVSVFDAMSTALLLTDGDGTPRWHNRALAALLDGLPATAISLRDVAPGTPAVEIQLPGCDHSGRWVEVRCRPMGDHRLYELADVTTQRAEREHSNRHEWRLAHTERLANIGTWEWHPATGAVVWSEALLESFGYPVGSTLDYETYVSLLHPEDVPLIEGTLTEALQKITSFSYTHRMYLADRVTLRHFECYGEVFADETGAPVRVLGVAHDITDIRRTQDELTYLADHDPLTGMVNRRVVTARLGELLAGKGTDGSRAGGRLTDGRLTGGSLTGGLLIIDIDNFKDVNDLRGHAVGDEVMRCMARLVQDHLPQTAVLGRLGGDEFAVVLAEGDSVDALAAGEAICNAASSTPLVVFGDPLRVTVSIGAAPVDGESDCEVLLAHADLALYEAKNAGRNRTRLFAPEQYRHAVQRVNVVRRVREALDTGRLELDAQPIVDLASGRTTSYELLARLRDGVYPEIGPADFLPTLERGDLVRELDRWVIEQATAALARPVAVREGLCLDVNVSSRSMDDAGFGEWVVSRLRQMGIDPPRLGLEITETTAISNLDAARRLAATLTSAGCRFSLDDFGAGFGSFVYLKHLPFTTVKIAGEFVSQADVAGSDDRVLVDAVVRAATGLGMTTVAEYIDREPLVAALQELGVDRGQGFHLGKPAPLRLLVGDYNEPAVISQRQHRE